MRKFLVFLSVYGIMNVYAWNPPDFTLGFTPDTRQVAVSSNTAAPTQLCTRDSYVQRTIIVNTTQSQIFISTISTNLSTTTSFAIPGSSTTVIPVIFSPDGVNSPFTGAIFAISPAGTTIPTVSVFRSK